MMLKYWDQRYRIFSKYDHGIVIDNEGWYSTTFERIAQYIAKKFTKFHITTIIDCFSGIGGTTIPFARGANRVIAIDNNPDKFRILQINAAIYNTNNNIEMITGDVYETTKDLAATRKLDRETTGIICSPPWGGPEYVHRKHCSIRTFPSGDMFELMKVLVQITNNIVLILPRNTDMKEIKELHKTHGLSCRVEEVFLHDKHKLTLVNFS
jgi:trimethylguanosine synthase